MAKLVSSLQIALGKQPTGAAAIDRIAFTGGLWSRSGRHSAQRQSFIVALTASQSRPAVPVTGQGSPMFAASGVRPSSREMSQRYLNGR